MRTLLIIAVSVFSLLAKAQDQTMTYGTLGDEDKKILENGEMGNGRYISGGAVGSIFGFGIGHAIQGRYSEKGWIFAVGEAATGLVVAAGLLKCIFGLGRNSCED